MRFEPHCGVLAGSIARFRITQPASPHKTMAKTKVKTRTRISPKCGRSRVFSPLWSGLVFETLELTLDSVAVVPVGYRDWLEGTS